MANQETVCLVIPPSAFLLDDRVFMSLGILKVAAVLKQAGHVVEVVDLSGVANYEEALRQHAAGSSARCFGLTATTPQMPTAVRACAAIQSVRPDARLILGGPHVTLVNAARRREENLGRPGRGTRQFQAMLDLFDVLVAGDGEVAIFHALAPDAPRFIDADDRKSPLFLKNADLNVLPFPARHLVDVDSYHYQIDGLRALSLIAQLGCPFACGFCGGRETSFLRLVRMRSPERVIAEIMHMHNVYGVRGFMLYDDELNVNPRMVELMNGIAQAQHDRGVEFRLRGFVKSELFNDAQAESMVRAGFRWLLVGFESGSPRILQNINKKATREDNTRCVGIARKHGLKVKALMSVGHPGESQQTVDETRDWLLEVRPDDFDLTIITTYPGTPYFDHAERHSSESGTWTYTCPRGGDLLHAREVDYTQTPDYYKGAPDGGYKAYVYTDHVSSEELVDRRDQVEREVRQRLGIAYPKGAAPILYEHSMGQAGRLPATLLRSSMDPAPTNKVAAA